MFVEVRSGARRLYNSLTVGQVRCLRLFTGRKRGAVSRANDMTTRYETDIVAWANEQASFIRNGQFDMLDLEHLAQEIEDVGKSEQRELASRMAVLLMHLLKWQFQPERHSASWQRTIKEQRRGIAIALRETPSLKTALNHPDWQEKAWTDAVSQAAKETGLANFPDACPWSMQDVLTEGWLPPSV